MSKIFTIALLCLSFCAIGLLLTLSSFVRNYKSLNTPNIIKGDDGQILEDDQYQKLLTLASYPIVGNFYAERLIKEMVLKKQWESVLEKSSIALESIINRRSYKIWYYKAVAECASF